MLYDGIFIENNFTALPSRLSQCLFPTDFECNIYTHTHWAYVVTFSRKWYWEWTQIHTMLIALTHAKLGNEWKSYIIIPKWCKSAKSRQEYSIRAFKKRNTNGLQCIICSLPRGISRLHGLFFHSIRCSSTDTSEKREWLR